MRTLERAALPLAIAAAIVLTCAVIVGLARWSPLIPNHVAQELERERALNGLYLYDAGYVDDADYVLVGQVPLDDYSRGGVYFFGDSRANAAIRTWDLPPAERCLIHNYAIGDMRYRDLRLFIEMLVEDFDLLEAGGDKTTVVLSLTYQMTRHLDHDTGGYVRHAFLRHGIYGYDEEGRLHRVRMAPAEWWLRSMRNDAERFLTIASLNRYSRVKPVTPEEQTVEFNRLGGDWRAAMEREIAELETLLDYLQARGVHVRAILRPSGSWDDGLPYQAAHDAMVAPLLATRGIPLTDQTRLLTDAEMVDHTHVTYRGRIQLHAHDRQLALDALRQMGVEVR